MNQVATTELKKIFKKNVFSYPKPVSFIEKVVRYTTEKDAIVMDFFSGFRVIIMTVANSSVKSKVLKLLSKLKTEETDGLCVA